MSKLKPLPEFINGFRVVEDLGMVETGEMKLRKKTGLTPVLRRGALFECHVCKKLFKNSTKQIVKYKSCGCQITKVSKKPLPKEIFGYEIIEDLDVIYYKDRKRPVRCCRAICKKCGEIFTTTIINLKRNPIGCDKQCSFFNGGNPRLCKILGSMRDRCYNPKHKSYKDYGAKGIIVCDEWLASNRSFYDWALLNGYQDDLTIDRIDGTKGYFPDNCRWADKNIQSQNSIQAKLNPDLVIKIRELSKTMFQKDIAIMFGLSKACVCNVIHKKTWRNI